MKQQGSRKLMIPISVWKVLPCLFATYGTGRIPIYRDDQVMHTILPLGLRETQK